MRVQQCALPPNKFELITLRHGGAVESIRKEVPTLCQMRREGSCALDTKSTRRIRVTRDPEEPSPFSPSFHTSELFASLAAQHVAELEAAQDGWQQARGFIPTAA